MDTGLLSDCEQVSMFASLEQIQSCHTAAHSIMFGTDAVNKREMLGQELHLAGTLNKLTVLPCGGSGVDADTYPLHQLMKKTDSPVKKVRTEAIEEVKSDLRNYRPQNYSERKR